MANIDITGLFSDVLGSTQQQQTERELQRRDAETQANLVGQLGGMAAYLAPQRSAELSSAAGGLLGLDTRSEADKLREQLQALGTPKTAQEHQRYADLLDKLKPGSGVQYMMSVAQEQRASDIAGAEVSRAATAERVAQTDEERLTLEQQEAAALNTNRIRIDRRAREDQRLEGLRIEATNKATAARAAETDVYTKKAMEEAYKESGTALERARQAGNIADKLAVVNPASGAVARFEETKNDFFGTQTEAEALRTEIRAMTNSMVMSSLPPGAASDKDIELAMKGVPRADSDPEILQQYFRGVAKIAAIKAYEAELKLKHLDEEGDIGGFPAKWRAAQKDEKFLTIIAENTGLPWLSKEEDIKKQKEADKAAFEAAKKADATAVEEGRRKAAQLAREEAAEFASSRFGQFLSTMSDISPSR